MIHLTFHRRRLGRTDDSLLHLLLENGRSSYALQRSISLPLSRLSSY